MHNKKTYTRHMTLVICLIQFVQISTIVSLRRVNMTEYALTSRTATTVHVLRDTPASNVKLVRYLEHVTLLFLTQKGSLGFILNTVKIYFFI